MLDRLVADTNDAGRTRGTRGGHYAIMCTVLCDVEATTDPSFFGLYAANLAGCTGVGHAIEDCLSKAKWDMEEHIILLRDQGFSIPEPNPDPTVLSHNERRIEAVA